MLLEFSETFQYPVGASRRYFTEGPRDGVMTQPCTASIFNAATVFIDYMWLNAFVCENALDVIFALQTAIIRHNNQAKRWTRWMHGSS